MEIRERGEGEKGLIVMVFWGKGEVKYLVWQTLCLERDQALEYVW
jgi:hypothetical protein